MSAKEASDGMEIIATIVLPFMVILCLSALVAFAVSTMSDHNTTITAVTMAVSTILLSSLYFGLVQFPIAAAFKRKEIEETEVLEELGNGCNGRLIDEESTDTEEQISSSLTDEDKSAIYCHGEEVFRDITAKERQDRLDQIEEYIYHTMSPLVYQQSRSRANSMGAVLHTACGRQATYQLRHKASSVEHRHTHRIWKELCLQFLQVCPFHQGYLSSTLQGY